MTGIKHPYSLPLKAVNVVSRSDDQNTNYHVAQAPPVCGASAAHILCHPYIATPVKRRELVEGIHGVAVHSKAQVALATWR